MLRSSDCIGGGKGNFIWSKITNTSQNAHQISHIKSPPPPKKTKIGISDGEHRGDFSENRIVTVSFLIAQLKRSWQYLHPCIVKTLVYFEKKKHDRIYSSDPDTLFTKVD